MSLHRVKLPTKGILGPGTRIKIGEFWETQSFKMAERGLHQTGSTNENLYNKVINLVRSDDLLFETVENSVGGAVYLDKVPMYDWQQRWNMSVRFDVYAYVNSKYATFFKLRDTRATKLFGELSKREIYVFSSGQRVGKSVMMRKAYPGRLPKALVDVI